MARRPGPGERKVITDYWLEFYSDNLLCLCSLCGNTGVIDTKTSAVSPAGFRPGRKNWCICPNGQQLRYHAKGRQPEEIINAKTE